MRFSGKAASYITASASIWMPVGAAIVSMRSLDGKLCATLEIELPGRILVQVKESCNRQPSAVVCRHIKAYVEAVGLSWKKSA